MGMREYVVKADSFPQVVSAPDKPLKVVEHRKGDRVELDEARGQQLVKAGALADPEAQRDAKRKAKQERAEAEKAAAERAEREAAEKAAAAQKQAEEEAQAKADADKAAADAANQGGSK